MRLWDAMIVEICFPNIKTNFGFGILVVSFHILVVPAVFVPSRSFSFLPFSFSAFTFAVLFSFQFIHICTLFHFYRRTFYICRIIAIMSLNSACQKAGLYHPFCK